LRGHGYAFSAYVLFLAIAYSLDFFEGIVGRRRLEWLEFKIFRRVANLSFLGGSAGIVFLYVMLIAREAEILAKVSC
jgi:hypothetical protein